MEDDLEQQTWMHDWLSTSEFQTYPSEHGEDVMTHVLVDSVQDALGQGGDHVSAHHQQPYERDSSESEEYGHDDDDENSSDDYRETEESSEEEDVAMHPNVAAAAAVQPTRRRRGHPAATAAAHKDYLEEDCLAPEWFSNQPFLYHGRLALLALPGGLVAVGLGGEWLLTVLAAGLLTVYLFHEVIQDYKWSHTVYVMTCWSANVVLLLCMAPFLWRWPFSLFLLTVVVGYVILTFCWGALSSEAFRAQSPESTKLVETQLFFLYPACFVVLTTWLVSHSIGLALSPYFLLLISFLVCQWFLPPTASSFCLPECTVKEHYYILEPWHAAVALVTFTLSPCLLQALLTVLYTSQSLASLSFMVEFVFLLASSVYLATFLPSWELAESIGVSRRQWCHLKWACGMTSVMSLPCMLSLQGVTSTLLPWWALGFLTSHAVCGFLASWKKRVIHQAAVCIPLLYTVSLFMNLPWNLHYSLGSPGPDLHTMYVCLLLHAVLSIFCTYASLHYSPEILGLCLMSHAVVHTTLVTYLQNASLVSPPGVWFTCAVYLYLTVRLHHVKKLTWQHTLLILALHATFLTVDLTTTGTTYSHMTYGYRFAVNFPFIALHCYLLLFSTSRELTTRKHVVSCVASGLSSLLSGQYIIPALWHRLTATQPLLAHYIGISLLLVSIVSIKLARGVAKDYRLLPWQHQTAPVLVLFAGLFLALQPELEVSSDEAMKLLTVTSILAGLVLLRFTKRFTSVRAVALLCFVAAGPVGFQLPAWIPGSGEVSFEICLWYGLLLSTSLMAAIFVHVQRGDMECRLTTLLVSTFVECVLLLATDFVQVTEKSQGVNLGHLGAALGCLLQSVTLRIYTKFVLKMALTKNVKMSYSHLPLCGNISTVASLVLVLLLWPGLYIEPWVTGCSLLLLLLQRDSKVFTQLTTHNWFAPSIVLSSGCIFLSSLFKSSLWRGSTGTALMASLLEMIVLVTTLPLLLLCWTLCWNKQWIISPRTVTILSPLYFVLLFVATSYASRLMAVVGIVIALWIMVSKMGVHVDL